MRKHHEWGQTHHDEEEPPAVSQPVYDEMDNHVLKVGDGRTDTAAPCPVRRYFEFINNFDSGNRYK